MTYHIRVTTGSIGPLGAESPLCNRRWDWGQPWSLLWLRFLSFLGGSNYQAVYWVKRFILRGRGGVLKNAESMSKANTGLLHLQASPKPSPRSSLHSPPPPPLKDALGEEPVSYPTACRLPAQLKQPSCRGLKVSTTI